MKNLELEKQQAARNYVECTFYHDDLEKPEFQDSIDMIMEDFMAGVDYAHQNRNANAELIEAVSYQYASGVIKEMNGDIDWIESSAVTFEAGANWYREHHPTIWDIMHNHPILTWFCVFVLTIAFIAITNH